MFFYSILFSFYIHNRCKPLLLIKKKYNGVCSLLKSSHHRLPRRYCPLMYKNVRVTEIKHTSHLFIFLCSHHFNLGFQLSSSHLFLCWGFYFSLWFSPFLFFFNNCSHPGFFWSSSSSMSSNIWDISGVLQSMWFSYCQLRFMLTFLY